MEELEDGPFLLSEERTIAAMMATQERRLLHDLPDEFVVWRGCYRQNRDGLSWSMHKHVAEKFPFLHAYRVDTKRPLLLRGLINKRQVIALKAGRKESEVILRGPRDVTITTAVDPDGRFRWVAKEKRIIDVGVAEGPAAPRQ